MILKPLIQKFHKGKSYFANRSIIRRNYNSLFRQNDIQICYNKNTLKTYKKGKKNILIAIESPALIEYYQWLKPEMEFIAEISFKNFYNLDNYYCPKTLYTTNDNFVNMPSWQALNKTKLVSLIYSHKNILPGHKIRHKIAMTYKDQLDLMGSGSGKFLKSKSDSLLPYKYQVVIENCKHPNYVSEKFFDCLKTQTIPIYWGGEETVRELGFDSNSIIFFNNPLELSTILNMINKSSYYEDRFKSIEQNYNLLKKIRESETLKASLSSIALNYFHSEESYSNLRGGQLRLDI